MSSNKKAVPSDHPMQVSRQDTVLNDPEESQESGEITLGDQKKANEQELNCSSMSIYNIYMSGSRVTRNRLRKEEEPPEPKLIAKSQSAAEKSVKKMVKQKSKDARSATKEPEIVNPEAKKREEKAALKQTKQK